MPTHRPKSRAFSTATCVIAVFLVTAASSAAAYAHAPLIGLLEDFDTNVPALTIWALRIAPWQYLTAGAVISVLLIAKELLLNNPNRTVALNAAAAFAAIIFAVVFGIAYLLPLAHLMQSML